MSRMWPSRDESRLLDDRDPCPMGCGRLTDDPYGGPCTACWSAVNDCPTEDDDPVCWVAATGGGARCGLEVDHDGEHSYTIWTPPKAD